MFTFEEYQAYLNKMVLENKKCEYDGFEKFGPFETEFKWVGGVLSNNGNIYGITNGSTDVLEINTSTNQIKRFGSLPEGKFKWTGGCNFSNDQIIGFPRSANSILKIDCKNRKAESIPINTKYTNNDHHYSGTIVGNYAYVAPRFTSQILKINLLNYKVTTIGDGIIPKESEYCGTIAHPNGKIYFLPQKNAHVMVYNPENDDVSFIGEKMVETKCCFSAVIYKDMNIYGFLGYTQGVLKIDVTKNTSYILCQNDNITKDKFGTYGTRLTPNGKMISICGDMSDILEFDPETITTRKIDRIDDKGFNSAKCAGGVLAPDGNVWMVPALGRYVYKLKFKNVNYMPPIELLSSIFFTNY